MKDKNYSSNFDLIYKKKIKNYHAYYEPMKCKKVLKWENYTYTLPEINQMMILSGNKFKTIIINPSRISGKFS